MILDLLEHWPVDLQLSLLVGDKESDLEAAESAGVRGVRYFGGDICVLVRDSLGK